MRRISKKIINSEEFKLSMIIISLSEPDKFHLIKENFAIFKKSKNYYRLYIFKKNNCYSKCYTSYYKAYNDGLDMIV